MKKLITLVVLSLSYYSAFSQVGINNTNPQASLDITATNVTAPSNTDGMLIPRIDDFPITNPTAAQDGMLVFATGAGTPTEGFYYWNDDITSWSAVGGGANSLDQAYDQGGAGAGRIITADTGALEIMGLDGLRVEGDAAVGANIIHDGDTDTFMSFTPDRIELDAGGINYMDVQNAGSIITFNGDSNELDFRIESGTNQNMFFVDGSENTIGIGTNTPENPLEIDVTTAFDLNSNNIGQDAIFIAGGGDNSGVNAIGGSITFGPPANTRRQDRKSAISSVQTGVDIDFTGLAFYVHGNPVNVSPMIEGMRLTHNRQLGINNTSPSANLDVIGTLQYEDGNEAAGYVLASDASGNATWTDPLTIISDTDDQQIDVLNLNGTDLEISLQDDGVATQILDLSSLQDGTGNDWSSTGNTVIASNFMGSTNNVDVRFRANNIEKMRLTPQGQLEFYNTGNSVFIGELAGENDDLTNNNNTFVGYRSGQGVIDGFGNTALGQNSLQNTTTGDRNVALGAGTLLANTIGNDNIAIGSSVMVSNTTEGQNIAIGYAALFEKEGGSSNVAIGYRAGAKDLLSDQNVYVGHEAGGGFIPDPDENKSGNVFIGYRAGYDIQDNNRLVIENSDADEDAALIYGEFDNDILRINGELQVSNPTGAGYALPTADGTANQVLETDGSGQLSWITPTSSVTASNGLTASAGNVTLGGALAQNTSITQGAFDINFNLTSAAGNFTVDTNTLVVEATGDVGIGITNPAYNLDVSGFEPSSYVANFRNTVASGSEDGIAIRLQGGTTSFNHFIDFYRTGGTINSGAVQGAGAGVVYATTSDRRLKTNIVDIPNALETIAKMQPRLYEYKEFRGKREFGFIAQELKQVYPQAVAGVESDDPQTSPMMVDYGRLTPILTAGIQELRQKVRSFEEENKQLKKQLEAYQVLEARISALENKRE